MFKSTVASLGKLEEVGINTDRLENWVNPQSMAFMVDLMPVIRSLFKNGRVLRVLDVGSRSGAGVALLNKLYGPASMSKVKMDITCLDIESTFKGYFDDNFPEIDYVVGDIFELEETFDLVICSHVIEHVAKADEFLARLRQLATEYVVLNCPFMESPDSLSPGHVQSIDIGFLERNDCHMKKIYEGLYWRQGAMVISVFEGMAEN